MTEAINLQAIMMALQRFWAAHGCLIWQPYHTEVGAGTMNPATFLRVLGPEPWNVAYVEPSIRPADGRYGENPNRLQQHYQFQVILKPDPGNPQELYLQSLQALGIDLHKHDIRFVEDNWEAPMIGAWGLGWQVWLDGQEITQFTYFQQAGGINLDPVSVELTYGLERIAMPLQGVHDFRDIRWDENFSYGDVKLQAEQEHSKYFFEIADVERLRQMFDLYEAEAKAALEQGLVLPAHDYVLKCSNAFNVLDTRGAVGVTERQAYFGRTRDLARYLAESYMAQRQALEYPWLSEDARVSEDLVSPAPKEPAVGKTLPLGPVPFVLEIGTEELPPHDLRAGLDQLRDRFSALLKDLRLDHREIRTLGTPRRMVVHVGGLAPRQRDLDQLVKGPPASRAFDADGNPTKAGEGFARSKGITADKLEVVEMDGGEYVVAPVKEIGRPTAEVLAEAVPAVIASLRFDKSMRWNDTNVAFSRPIRWLLALHGSAVVPFEYAGVRAGNVTRGLRNQEKPTFSVHTADDYFAALEEQGIILDVEERKDHILREMVHLAEEVQGQLFDDPTLLADVTNEVEAPRALRGDFDSEFRELPREVLIAVMKHHQNYFPIEQDGSLLPYFVTVCNGGEQDLDEVARGNQDVIRARFADGAFFIKEDRKRSLADHVPFLQTLTFQTDLGSMLDKTHRIVRLVEEIGPEVGLGTEDGVVARRAGELCKADLVTNMVVEMTSLQGIMGRYYAKWSGEPEPVATAIFEHYLPRFAGDNMPKSRAGLTVGLADRLDSLAGLFAAGLTPTGAKDPFAQRRAALGLVGILISWDLDLDLRSALRAAAANLPIQASEESQRACLVFIVGRLRNLLLEAGQRYDVIEAVLAAQGHNPANAARAVRSLGEWVAREDWHTTLPAYARCVRITRSEGEIYQVNPEAFQEDAERMLYAALAEAEGEKRKPGSVDDFLNAFTPLIPPINRFFDDVLVMDEDLNLRHNRLALLQRIAALADGVADLSALEGF
jgi:glycyl-tRNA synthetase